VWLHVATTTTKIYAELWKTPFAKLLKNVKTYVTEDMEAHPSVCPASRCTYGFTGRVAKAYLSDSNQITVAYWSVYGDFSPNLYFV
jgi:hypothetical protein